MWPLSCHILVLSCKALVPFQMLLPLEEAVEWGFQRHHEKQTVSHSPHPAVSRQLAPSPWVTRERGQGCTGATDADRSPRGRDSESLAGEQQRREGLSLPVGSGGEFCFNHLLSTPSARGGFP